MPRTNKLDLLRTKNAFFGKTPSARFLTHILYQFLVVPYFILIMVPRLASAKLFFIILNSTLYFLYLVFTLACMMTDPTSKLVKAQLEGTINKNLSNGRFICNVCAALTTKTTRHCKLCDRCIGDYDHHSYWINSCIGANNMKYYTKAILFCLLFHISFNVLNLGYCISIASENHPKFLKEETLDESVWRIMIVLVSSILSAWISVWMIMLNIFYFYLKKKKINAYEYKLRLKQKKKKSKVSPGLKQKKNVKRKEETENSIDNMKVEKSTAAKDKDSKREGSQKSVKRYGDDPNSSKIGIIMFEEDEENKKRDVLPFARIREGLPPLKKSGISE